MHKLNPILIIPARLDSTRLPRKILADIMGKSMVARVYDICQTSQVGPVVVACDGPEIAVEITQLGGHVELTDPSLPSGSDRAHAAVCQYDPDEKYNVVVVVQGDLPTLDPQLIQQVLRPLENPDVDMATLAAAMTDPDEINSVSVCKIAMVETEPHASIRRALYFSRCPVPYNADVKYHHIGIYAYRRQALARYVALPPSPLEQIEKLEQLRALEAGMRIDVSIVDTVPLGVDTPADLVKACLHYQQTLV